LLGRRDLLARELGSALKAPLLSRSRGGEVSFDLLQHPRQRDGEREEGSIEVGLSEVLYPLHSRHRGAENNTACNSFVSAAYELTLEDLRTPESQFAFRLSTGGSRIRNLGPRTRVMGVDITPLTASAPLRAVAERTGSSPEGFHRSAVRRSASGAEIDSALEREGFELGPRREEGPVPSGVTLRVDAYCLSPPRAPIPARFETAPIRRSSGRPTEAIRQTAGGKTAHHGERGVAGDIERRASLPRVGALDLFGVVDRAGRVHCAGAEQDVDISQCALDGADHL